MNILSHTTIVPTLSVTLSVDDLAEQLRRVPGGERLIDQAAEVLTGFGHTWSSAAVFRTMVVEGRNESHLKVRVLENGHQASLALGCSTTFLNHADLVVAGGYTVGKKVQDASSMASRRKDYLASYLIEQLGLTLLGKTGAIVNHHIEAIAGTMGWGVGPLLSPGSVHGWELTDQENLCKLLPLAEIGMECGAGGVLAPFNSLTFLVGLGPDYTSSRIGSPCAICNNRRNCYLHHDTP
jgi:hypothetical protein